jgi:excisionase family DNA binding protein
MAIVKKQPMTAAIKTRSTKRKRIMKIEQQTAQLPGSVNGQIQPSTGRTQTRFALPSPETIAAHTVPPPAKPEPLAYDINQAAAALNVCTKTVRRLLARGKLTSCKELRKILIPREQIAAFLKATCGKPDFQA